MATISDINSEARDLCDADSTSYTAAVLLRRINKAYEQVVGWLINADGIWEFDDSNYTTTPIGTYTLVNNQRSYTFAADFLDLLELSVMDSGGTLIKIPQFDPFIETLSVEELYGTQTGFPSVFDLVSDDTIKFYPNISSTNVTLASGLQVKFKRTADLYTSAQVTTGTKEPGFASPWHYILSYMAAIPFCAVYKQDRVSMLEREVERMKKELIFHYSRRNKDSRNIMTMKQVSHI
jgi:hypothetical protein